MPTLTTEQQQALRTLPSVDKLLAHPTSTTLSQQAGRTLLVEALRHALDDTRQTILRNGRSFTAEESTETAVLARAEQWLTTLLAPTLRPVINGTGIIIHTNLGRAPLSNAAQAAMQAVSSGYSTLEYDPAAGKRGSRAVHAEKLLQRLTGAEAALVVNNNAAAVVLMLTALCLGKEVAISRGQLVEIGGGFRVPDVMAQSGALLVEVGTTNKTHLYDYERAISPETAAFLIAHYSNYKIIGFTSEPTLEELAQLAHQNDVSLLYDQGSGALLNVADYGLEGEKTVQQSLTAGCDVVAFSGDKLLGGPQAGILCGKASLINQIKRHPLARAVRADKLCLAALAATLQHYLLEEATEQIPVWQMIALPLETVQKTAESWATALQKAGAKAEVIAGESAVGGGSLPGTTLPTRLLAIDHANPTQLAATLRAQQPALVGRLQDGRFLIDPRTILPAQHKTALHLLQQHVP